MASPTFDSTHKANMESIVREIKLIQYQMLIGAGGLVVLFVIAALTIMQ